MHIGYFRRIWQHGVMAKRLLWHYTNFGIMQSDSLRFGDAAFLNDSTERSYALGIARNVVRAKVGTATRDRKLLSLIGEYLTPEVWFTRMYICSLSETPESISQWQRYGADGRGYCIGLDPELLSARYASSGVDLRRMIYRPQQQRSLIAARLKEVIQSVHSGELRRDVPLPAKANIDDMAPHATLRLTQRLLEIKNPQFQDEREWRLIYETSEHGPLDYAWEEPEFTVRDPYVKAFIVPPLASTPPRLPVAKVVCGPKLDDRLATESTRTFLRAAGYSMVEVVPSKLRRAWR